jgi:hypothetical protein
MNLLKNLNLCMCTLHSPRTQDVFPHPPFSPVTSSSIRRYLILASTPSLQAIDVTRKHCIDSADLPHHKDWLSYLPLYLQSSHLLSPSLFAVQDDPSPRPRPVQPGAHQGGAECTPTNRRLSPPADVVAQAEQGIELARQLV